MALYPFLLGIATQVNVLDDIQVDRSVDGTPRFRSFYTAYRREWVIDHSCLTAAEQNVFWNWYSTYRNGTVFQIAPNCADPTAQVPVMISGAPRIRYLGNGMVAAALPVTEAQ